MPNLIPIKVVLRHDDNGVPRTDQNGKKTVWPNLRVTDPATRDNTPPHEYVDRFGGFMTNKADNLGTGADFGEAVALVPVAFADECVAQGVAEIITEAAFDTFYETKHVIRQTAFRRDADALAGLKAERDLRVARGMDTTDVDAEIDKALDPDDPRPGVSRTPDMTASAYKGRRGIVISR